MMLLFRVIVGLTFAARKQSRMSPGLKRLINKNLRTYLKMGMETRTFRSIDTARLNKHAPLKLNGTRINKNHIR